MCLDGQEEEVVGSYSGGNWNECVWGWVNGLLRLQFHLVNAGRGLGATQSFEASFVSR